MMFRSACAQDDSGSLYEINVYTYVTEALMGPSIEMSAYIRVY